MIYAKPSQLTDAGSVGALQTEHLSDSRYSLTAADMRGMEQLLHRRGPDGAKLSPLLTGLIRKKMRMSRELTGPAPQDLAASNRLVTYKIEGESARSGVLSMSTIPLHGTIPIGSLLGATLVGLTRSQKATLVRDDGEIGTVTVLDIDLLNDGLTTA